MGVTHVNDIMSEMHYHDNDMNECYVCFEVVLKCVGKQKRFFEFLQRLFKNLAAVGIYLIQSALFSSFTSCQLV